LETVTNRTSVCPLIYDLVSKDNNSVDIDEIYYMSSPRTVVRQTRASWGLVQCQAYFTWSRKFLPILVLPIFLDWLK